MPATNKVTVGMPVYNDPSGLLRSVPTVFNQTWTGDLQLLLIDDGSTDETPSVISTLQEIYGGIEVVRNDHNHGRPFARNQVLDNADGEYLAWLDCGDLWHPTKLETQLRVLTDAENDEEAPVLCTSSFRWVFADTGQEQVKVPDVSGDQLYNALTSKLPPYLWTMLGRTSAFRMAGRFDERLPRRQDYEFFVRFIERGGRVVTTRPDPPLATYMKTDVGRSPAEVAAANRVIHRLHRPLYSRYGSRFARVMRRRQLVLEARFYENNGERLTAVGHRAFGWLVAPSLPSFDGVRARLRRWWRRIVNAGARFLVRALKPALPFLRRVGVTSLLRRFTNPQDVLPGYYQELEKGSPPAADVAERLEAAISGQDGSAQVAAWLKLEQTYRRGGQLDSAQSALERGQREHPGNTELQLRLLELLPLRGAWDECVSLWSSLSPSQIEAASPTTYNRVAWAYRELDQADESLLILEKGLDLWHGDRWLLAQLQKARASSTDWRTAMTIETSSSRLNRGTPTGSVTQLGFLTGDVGPVRGWRDVAVDADPTVDLILNGTMVASTKAAPSEEGQHIFSFNCRGLLEFLGDGDVVSFVTPDGPLPIDGTGDRCVFHPGYESQFRALQQSLARGFVFENLGKLVEGNTPRRRSATLSLYDELRARIAKAEGYEVYPIYGNLLGAIRENDFIAHDVGGFDVVYVSRHSRPELVRSEFASICRFLVDNGYHVKLKPWSAYVRPDRYKDVFIDLNFGWFNDAGELNLSYGWRHAPVTDAALFAFPREAPLGSHWVPVPGNAEALLTQIYGPSWITPNQGYVPEEEMKRDEDFLLTDADMAAIRDHDPDQVVIVPIEDPENAPEFSPDGTPSIEG